MLALIALCIAPLTFSQQTDTATSGPAGQSVKGAQLKHKAPINPNTLRVHLPKPVMARLDNGLRIVLIEDHKLPTLYMQCVLLNRGDALDPAELHGLATATAALLRSGTASRTANALSEELDTLGGSLNGYSSTLDSYVTVTGLSDFIDPLLAIMSDVLLRPSFPEDELNRFKLRFVSQLQSQRASSNFAARERFYKAIYGDHPAGTIAPPEDQVSKLTAADLKSFHEKYYRPNAALLFVAGDVSMKELLPKVKDAFGEWQPNDVVPPELPPVHAPDKSQVFVVNRTGSVQTSLLMGSLGITGDAPDRYPVGVMNQVLGGSAASRLFMNLREDKGYTYGAYSSSSRSRYPGVVAAYADVRTAVTAGAMHEFMFELKRIATEPVDAVELANAKRAIVGRFALSLEEPRNFIANVFEQIVYGFPADYWDHYAERVDAVTATDVQRAAAKYFDLSRLQIVAVGDAAKIGDVMNNYRAEPASSGSP